VDWNTESMGRELDYDRPFDWGMMLGGGPFLGGEDRSLYSGGMGQWQPKCIVCATDGSMLVEVSLPGVKREDIDLRLVDGDLVLSGERKEEKSHKDEGYWSRERSYGKFRRRLWLPQGVQLDQIQASFHNGILQVLVPLPGRQGRERVQVGEAERREALEEKPTYEEWGGTQKQPVSGEAFVEKPTYEEWGGTQEQPVSKPVPEPFIPSREEGGPIQEAGTKEETKPLLEKEKEKEGMEQHRGSGIFIGNEAATTGPSSM
jgi:HSP20 family protein